MRSYLQSTRPNLDPQSAVFIELNITDFRVGQSWVFIRFHHFPTL